MKKLGKKINTSLESIEAYCQMYCSCPCDTNCQYSWDGMAKAQAYYSNQSSGGTYSHY